MACDPANPKSAQPQNIWQETFPVRFCDIDRSDRLTLNSVFKYFQEAAISHAENLNVGRQDMARTGQVWIISRITVSVERRPVYCETVTVRSWPRGGEKLFAMRDYDIRDRDDIPVVSARSGWVIVDMEKRRPLRPQAVMDALPQNEGLNALDRAPASLEERGNLVKKAERRALYTDLDYNGHVNNVRYIQWIEDAIEPKLLESADKMRFDINYMSETLENEVTEIFCAPIEGEIAVNSGAYAFEGRKQGSDKTAFRAELRLELS
jgi:acyl-ACP thioesterase